jgi:ankyrin repeat protein
MTALMYASMNGHDQVVKLLIEKGANMNLQDGVSIVL